MTFQCFFICALSLFCLQTNDYSVFAKAKIHSVNYLAWVNRDQSISIKASGKLVQHIINKELSGDGGISDLIFLDFDGDGYKDLVIEYLSNVPGISDLLIYDHVNNRFSKVKDFSKYPAPIRIPNSHIYYSYHRSGCADSDWDSDLFKIVNEKATTIGTISGRDCDEVEKGIFVYCCRQSGKQLIKKMSLQKLNNYKDTKWGLIADYWKHNYKKFQQ